MKSIRRDARLAIFQIGAGTQVSTIQRVAEEKAHAFPNSTLVHIDVVGCVPNSLELIGRVVSIEGLTAREALTRLDALLSGKL